MPRRNKPSPLSQPGQHSLNEFGMCRIVCNARDGTTWGQDEEGVWYCVGCKEPCPVGLQPNMEKAVAHRLGCPELVRATGERGET